ncbi:PucR family transcriptional regulator [Bacillus capparidis]|uniref:Purine catabolism regulator n=1 Tax=Bacillus capparidis TaxID=1840411 RepID=A0ABS4CVM6_9BACI|nr:PucR family transcriptional regulator [Bacillus capparidis]MBP1081119.1 purine catabolism regulator [Bacillus capparidis]MED1095804.1 PucR family transcriptional regulator [Bacillus capparidis]
MNIIDLMQLPIFKQAKIIGGLSGSGREVQHVNMMDAPDITDYLNKGDLLVTTAYHLKDEPELLGDLIIHMSNRGCAGLGIKTKRFLHHIPDSILELADQLAFPIIDLPDQVRLADIANQTLSYILDIRTGELQHAVSIHKRFTEHIMSGKGLRALLKNVSQLLDFPVLLVDHHLRILASSTNSTNVSDDLENGLQQLTDAAYTSFTLLSSKSAFSVFPIFTHEKKCGYLIVEGFISVSDKQKILTIEQATNVISFELMKDNALKQYTKRARNEFFSNFVEGVFSSESEIENRGKELNLKREQKYLCVAGKLDRKQSDASFIENQIITDTVFEFLEGRLSSLSLPSHFFMKSDIGVLLIEAGEYWGEENTVVSDWLKQMQNDINRLFRQTISFGVSNVCHVLLDVPESYSEATDALQTGYLSGNSQFVQFYHTKDISEILRMVPTDDLRNFYAFTLQKLSDLQYEEQSLLNTLSIYLETHCQISETAKRLYVHRNTVIYRLEKCEEILGVSLKDPDATLRLRLAFRIQMVLK